MERREFYRLIQKATQSNKWFDNDKMEKIQRASEKKKNKTRTTGKYIEVYQEILGYIIQYMDDDYYSEQDFRKDLHNLYYKLFENER